MSHDESSRKNESHRRSSSTSSSEPSEQKRSRPATSQILLAVLVLVAVLGALYLARSILLPITLAVVLALPLRPLIRWFGKVGLPPIAGAILVLVCFMTAIGFATLLLAGPTQQWMQRAPNEMRQIEYRMRSLMQPFAHIQEASEQVEKLASGKNGEEAEGEEENSIAVEVQQRTLTGLLFDATTEFIFGAVITFFLLLLLLALGDELVASIINLFQRDSDREEAREVVLKIERTISNYLLTYSVINVCLGVVIGLGLWWIGMPNPVLWGVMAGLMNFIPFAGLAIGTTVVAFVALLTFDSVSYALLAPAIYLLANGIEANCITPILLGRSMSLNPILVFLAVVFWGWMWGIVGALIAVPLLAATKIICDHFEPVKPVGMVLGRRPSGHSHSSLARPLVAAMPR